MSEFSVGDPNAWENGKRKSFTNMDLMYFSGLCHGYELKRKQLNLVAKLKGVEEEVAGRGHIE